MANLNDFYRGDTKVYNLTFTDSEGNPIPIPGWLILMTFKSSPHDTDAEAAVQETAVLTDPDAGKARVTLSHEVTDELLGKYFYGIQAKKVGGSIRTVTSGFVVVKYDATRSVS